MKSIHTFVHRFNNPDFGILLIRLAFGLVFINAGWMKITSMDTTIQSFGTLGFSPFLAYFVAWAELIGGVAFIVGIFSRYAGIILTIIMVVAVKILFVKGFSLAHGGYEFPLVAMLGSLAIVTFGSGAYSLARMLKRR